MSLKPPKKSDTPKRGTGCGNADRGRLKVGVELRQAATGSLLWVQSKLLVHAVAGQDYLIFDPYSQR